MTLSQYYRRALSIGKASNIRKETKKMYCVYSILSPFEVLVPEREQTAPVCVQSKAPKIAGTIVCYEQTDQSHLFTCKIFK